MEYDCRRRAARLLGNRPMSKGELRRKLIMKGESPEAADDAIIYLEEQGFLDDEQYAEEVVRYYSEKGYDAWRIKQELKRHLVPRDFWPEVN